MSKCKLVLVGARGLLGRALHEILPVECYTLHELDKEELDITNRERVLETIRAFNPDWVIHMAALTDVDYCEKHPGEAIRINEEGTKNICMALQGCKSKLLFMSTSMIFNGEKEEPYVEEDTPAPINIYGRTKLMAEKIISSSLQADDYLIIRTSWLFGRDGKNFLSRMPLLVKNNRRLKIDRETEGTLTYVKDLAGALVHLLESGEQGVFNITNKGCCTIWETIQLIAAAFGVGLDNMKPVEYDKLGYRAPRPRMQALDISKLERRYNITIPSWQNSLERYLNEFTE